MTFSPRLGATDKTPWARALCTLPGYFTSGGVLESLIIVKASDKGGALDVWRVDPYRKEALRKLTNTSFYVEVDKDLTSTNQQIVKSTINDFIVKQELPATATNVIITAPGT